jgi:hypothetical protein
MNAKPAKLRDGTWGARVTGTPKAGDVVTITTATGKSWQSTVAKVLWKGDGVALVALQKKERNWTDRRDIAPYGAVCDYCGQRDCARAWDPRALCDDD